MSDQPQLRSASGSLPYEHNLARFIYLLRLSGVSWAVATSAFFVLNFEGLRIYHVALLVIVLTYPTWLI
ncbi:MAG: hypothetical protein N3C12_03945 [Candidatus Binatia bacterium]|nr:hypothetical protein [Candidatus Binatia bacterium]